MQIDDATRTRLRDLGKRNGNRLSVEQLGQVLPVENLSPGDIAVLVEELEAEGIDVDLDEEWLKNRPKSSDYNRGDGVSTIATYAAPAVSAPGAVPSKHGFADDGPGERTGHGHGHGHGSKKAPTWDYDGVDLIPIACVAGVALVLMIALAP